MSYYSRGYMRITRQAVYGLVCLLAVAREKNRPVTITEISHAHGLSKDYIGQLMSRLKKKNLVRSIRGLRGGYVLARNPESITLKDVIEAEESKVLDIICFKEKRLMCGFKECGIKPVWTSLKEQIEAALNKIKLSGLLKKEKRTCR